MSIPPTETVDERTTAHQQWQRYEYIRDRGHREYVSQARKCERFYLGGGLQWSDADRAQVEGENRPCVEVNTIFPAVNTAVGEQLQSRVDVTFRPYKNGAAQEIADDLTKLTRQIMDDNHYEWLETEVFSDGIIQQRGYFDVRMDFDANLNGDIVMEVLDPLEVLPDPDATGYDPGKWGDVTITRWMSIDEVEQRYGKEAADRVEASNPLEPDFGIGDRGDGDGRNKFGGVHDLGQYWDATLTEKGTKRVRVIDRQHRRMENGLFFVAAAGDLRPVPSGMTRADALMQAQAGGMALTRKVSPRIRWTVTTREVVLHDEWSPYATFSVIPFFPYFRRGVTRGLVDNAISPQEMLNKATSQYLHIINTTANSGWMVEEGSLEGMTPDDLQDVGMKTGLVVVYRQGAAKPEKISANSIPAGHDRFADKAEHAIKSVTGISDAEQGMDSAQVSGVAIQAKQFQAKIQLSVPLDNQHRTRHLLATKILDLIQGFYTDERVVMITSRDEMGNVAYEPLNINAKGPDGAIVHDLTLGEYGVVIAAVPHQATFENTQFQQLLELKKIGVAIPDSALVQASAAAHKVELLKQMEGDPGKVKMSERMQELEVEEKAGKVALQQAQARKVDASAAVDAVEVLYSATQTAQTVATVPGVVPIADEIAKSAGFVDRNAAPLYPQPMTPALAAMPPQAGAAGMVAPQPRENTNPMFPPRSVGAGIGMMQGIETQANDGVGRG